MRNGCDRAVRPSRDAVKAAAPFLVPVVRTWHRGLTAWRSRPSYVARHAPFLPPDTFDQVFFDNRGNHPEQHIRTTRRFVRIAGARVLALGCRDGREALLWLRHGARSVTGLDYVASAATWRQIHDASPSVRFLAGDARTLPFADDTFDIVSSEALLEHVAHPAPAIREMHRVATPRGLVYANFGPLFHTAGGAHYDGDFEHLLLDRQPFIEMVERRNRPLEREECLHYFEHDMFSYWTADEYLHEFHEHAVLHSAVFVSPTARRFRRTHAAEWAQLRARYSERDLLISGLAVWSRKRS